ncbi:MAG: hypothetical protein R3B49_06340 [Phycisphaerales bacterium]
MLSVAFAGLDVDGIALEPDPIGSGVHTRAGSSIDHTGADSLDAGAAGSGTATAFGAGSVAAIGAGSTGFDSPSPAGSASTPVTLAITPLTRSRTPGLHTCGIGGAIANASTTIHPNPPTAGRRSSHRELASSTPASAPASTALLTSHSST